jgi:hypothetical protein
LELRNIQGETEQQFPEEKIGIYSEKTAFATAPESIVKECESIVDANELHPPMLALVA